MFQFGGGLAGGGIIMQIAAVPHGPLLPKPEKPPQKCWERFSSANYVLYCFDSCGILQYLLGEMFHKI